MHVLATRVEEIVKTIVMQSMGKFILLELWLAELARAVTSHSQYAGQVIEQAGVTSSLTWTTSTRVS